MWRLGRLGSVTYSDLHAPMVVGVTPPPGWDFTGVVGLDTEFTTPEGGGSYYLATHPWSIQLAVPTGDTRTITYMGESYSHRIYRAMVIPTHQLDNPTWLLDLLSQSGALKIAHYATADRHTLDNWMQEMGSRRVCVNVRDSHLESRLAFPEAAEYGLKFLATYILGYEPQPTFQEVAGDASVEDLVKGGDESFLSYAARDAVLAAELWEVARAVRLGAT